MQVPDSYLKDKNIVLKGRYSDKENVKKTEAALAMVENLDYNVGKVIDSLKKYELYDNTIIIYFCDNGPNGNRWNNDLKERKGSTNEGGVRVPFFIQWPKKIPSGIKVSQISSVLDVFPTLIELTNNSSEIDFDGLSFKKYLDDQKLKDDQRKVFSYWNKKISVRNNRFILDNQNNLFDLKVDHRQEIVVNNEFTKEYKELKKAKNVWKNTVVDKYKKSIERRRFTVNDSESVYTHLPARDAEITGDLKRSSIHANCSFIENWKNKEDYIYWDVEVLSSGKSNVELYYTLPKNSVGTQIAVEYEDQIIYKELKNFHDPKPQGIQKDIIKRIESYTKEFTKVNIGDIDFKIGSSVLKLKTSKKTGKNSIDFRLLVLKKQ